jgi:hypothetical protein
MVTVFADKVRDLLYRLYFRVTMGQVGSAVERSCGSSSIDDPKSESSHCCSDDIKRGILGGYDVAVSLTQCTFLLDKVSNTTHRRTYVVSSSR